MQLTCKRVRIEIVHKQIEETYRELTMGSPYKRIQADIRPGDVIAFSGDGLKAQGIRKVTHSEVSHVATVVRTCRDREDAPASLSHMLVEASWLIGEKPGVNAHWLEERLETYNGAMWWLPLSVAVRRNFDVENFQGYMLSQLGVPFDFVQSLQAAPDATDRLPVLRGISYAHQDLHRLFCSELVAAGLRAGGALRHVNCSEITPADISRFAVYDSQYVQIKGDRRRIQGYNSLNPEHWGLAERKAYDHSFSLN